MKKKSYKTSFLLLLALLLASCSHERVPDNILDTATFTAFLTEAQIVEAYAYASTSEDPDTIAFYTRAAYDSLYVKYNITPNIYDTNLAYYVHHPKTMEEIYARVSHNLKMIEEKSR